MLRKILSSLLVSIFIFGTLPLTSADNHLYSNTRAAVMQGSYGKYIENLERTIPLLSSEKLEEILSRIEEISYSKNATFNDFLIFLNILISSELDDRITRENISSEEKLLAEREVLALQQSITYSLNELLSEFIVLWNKENHYEEKGNLNMEIDMNIQDFLKYSLNMQLHNYIAEVQGLDSSISTSSDFHLGMESSYDTIDIDFSGDVDLITKDGLYYLSISDSKVTGENSNIFPFNLEKMLEKMQSLADNNSYLEISDQQTQAGLQMIKKFSPSQIEASIKHISEIPFLEAYSKNDGIYLLRPTQEFCSYMKSSTGIFDIFHGKECSEGQYKDLLEKFKRMGFSLELEVGKNNTLSIIIDHKEAKGRFDIAYSQYGIIEIQGNLSEPKNEEVNNISISFIPEELLHIKTNIENEINFTLEASLGQNNSLGRANIALILNETLQIESTYSHGQLDMTAMGDMNGDTLKCKLSGDMSSVFVDLEGECNISSSNYFSGEEEVYTFEGSVTADTRNKKNDVYLMMQGDINHEELFSFSLTNKATRKLVPQKEIITPKKSKNLGEFIGELQEEMYGDYFNDEALESFEEEYNYGEEDYYYENCYEYEGIEYCDINSDEYYFDAYSNIYYYDEYEYDATSGEYFYYDEY